MPIAVYQKVPPLLRSPGREGKGISLIAVILMVLGSLIIGSVSGPIVAYMLFTAPSLERSQELLSPLPSLAEAPDAKPLSTAVLRQQATAVAPVVYDSLDYHRPENWFPSVPLPKVRSSYITHYNLSIPALRIEEAIVTIGGDNLSESLIHYPGTAIPGELGSTVIFGHSILRQFYNPRNYISIFSTIMTLSRGDEIIIIYSGVNYTYRVIDKFQVKPADVEILQQRYDGRYLKLITCVPEGTYLRRGVVLAEQVN